MEKDYKNASPFKFSEVNYRINFLRDSNCKIMLGKSYLTILIIEVQGRYVSIY